MAIDFIEDDDSCDRDVTPDWEENPEPYYQDYCKRKKLLIGSSFVKERLQDLNPNEELLHLVETALETHTDELYRTIGEKVVQSIQVEIDDKIEEMLEPEDIK